VQNPKTLLRLLLFDIEAQPPQAPVMAVTIRADPVRARASQRGLFIPLAPEPEKLEITLARLGKLVGQDHVGSPELLDTHRPDAFRLKRFSVTSGRKSKSSKRKSATANRQYVMGFRMFRPPWHADVQTLRDQPVRINAHGANSSERLRGKVGRASGPWRASGEWWRADVWARDEWDVAVIEANNQQDEVICRIYRDLTSDKWFVAGIYD
jgi:protein ImuB